MTAYAIDAGLRVRVWAWDYTHAIHYYPDISNGYRWGAQGNQPRGHARGVLNVYDLVALQANRKTDEPREYGLDYAPLRLLMATRWVAWTVRTYPDLAAQAWKFAYGDERAPAWAAPYIFFAPMLRFNNAMELLAAAGIFFLARHWVIRDDRRCINQPAASPLSPLREVLLPFRGCFAGLLGALLFWFSPAILVSTHGWPTWDEWIVPFFVWAIYLACIDWWFAAGLVIALGAMLKGQQLFVAALFVLWPIFLGQFKQALTWTAGLALGVGLIASPWILTYVPGGVTDQSSAADRIVDGAAIIWLTGVAISAVALPLVVRWSPLWERVERAAVVIRARTRRIEEPPASSPADSDAAGAPWRQLPPWFYWLIRSSIAAVALILICWPFVIKSNRPFALLGVVLALFPVSQLLSLVRKSGGEPSRLDRFRAGPLTILVIGALSLGASILLCGVLFRGNLNWLYIGWGYGTRHYPYMTMGLSDNLAGLLDRRFGWHALTETVWTFDAHPLRLWPTHTVLFTAPTDISIRVFLVALYVATFLLAVVGVAIQFRRNDRRFLVAVTATWVMFFTFLPQIHERYLLYAAGFGCSLTAAGLGPTLLNLLFTALTCVMTMHVMLIHAAESHRLQNFATDISPTFGAALLRFAEGTFPDAAWAMMLCAAIMLYLSLAPSKRRSRKVANSVHQHAPRPQPEPVGLKVHTPITK